MNKETKINPDDVLDSLNGLKRATAPDFFYTRLRSRMERESNPQKLHSWIPKPIYAIAGLVLIILLNLAVILRNDNKTEKTQETEMYLSTTGDYNINDIITEEVYK